jgi:hypothetical protein
VTELITEKILKHHKTHYRQSLRHSSEASFAPEVDVASSSLQCFDPTTAGHSDANWLNDQGVWLGSYDEEKESVNGATFDEVTEKYFDDTTGGTSSYGVEPVVFDDMPAEPEMVMQCKACAVKGHVGLLKAEAWGFEWTENDTETRMTKNVSLASSDSETSADYNRSGRIHVCSTAVRSLRYSSGFHLRSRHDWILRP